MDEELTTGFDPALCDGVPKPPDEYVRCSGRQKPDPVSYRIGLSIIFCCLSFSEKRTRTPRLLLILPYMLIRRSRAAAYRRSDL